MNAIRNFFGFSSKDSKANASPDSMQKVQLFGKSEDENKEYSSEKLEQKLEKYRKKYHEKKKLYTKEHQTCKDYLQKIQENQEKITRISNELQEKKAKNLLLEEKIAEKKKKLQEMTQQFEKIPKVLDSQCPAVDRTPSLSSLQYENLKEKLEAKNKRVAELEGDLAKENQKTENLMKEITFLKIEIGKNN